VDGENCMMRIHSKFVLFARYYYGEGGRDRKGMQQKEGEI
jgi:hypothetical protein